jgi:hypothetical protein
VDLAGPWGPLGATRWRWRPDVRREVARLLSRHSGATANTYIAHPWVGWSRVSVDFWGPGGRGDPIAYDLGERLLLDAFHHYQAPPLRHYIYVHQLWTSFGGYSYWSADDHSGALRHVHLTYWK